MCNVPLYGLKELQVVEAKSLSERLPKINPREFVLGYEDISSGSL
jgi:hypothetical protein